MTTRWKHLCATVGAAVLLHCPHALAEPKSPLADRIQSIVNRPEFQHSQFGMEFYSLTDNKLVFAMNQDKFFIPASTAKLFFSATALSELGADYRFHTKVYRTGAISNGTLDGDLVLVASGDLNLSNRVRPDGTLAYTNMDHSYDVFPNASTVEGDPLSAIRSIANQVVASGIKVIKGRVLVDTSLFRQGQVADTKAVISPIVVNDNIVDVTVTPGKNPGDKAVLHVSPETGYAQFTNKAITAEESSPATIALSNDITNPDGTHTVTVSGAVAAGGKPVLRAYSVPEPARFAEMALAKALNDDGVKANVGLLDEPDFKSISSSYTPSNQVADYVSPPLSEAIKVLLKVSQSLHAGTLAYLLGAIAGHDGEHAFETGFALHRKFLQNAGLDLSADMQNDGGGVDAHVTPDFTVHLLRYVSRQPYFQAYLDALPIMGRDGTLAGVQKESRAAGFVHAKTGTAVNLNLVAQSFFLNSNAICGYIETPNGQLVAFALYVNDVPIKTLAEVMNEKVEDELGEIAAAIFDSLNEESERVGSRK